MSLDTATIRRIAALARLRLEDHEVAQAQTEINGILGWIEQLQAVDTDGVEPMAGGSAVALVAAPLRVDAVTDGGQADAVLAQYAGKIPLKIKSSSMVALGGNLDNYNNGRISGASHCN